MSAPTTARTPGKRPPGPPQAGLFVLVKPYSGLVATLAALTVLANALNLAVPKLIARAIDDYQSLTSRWPPDRPVPAGLRVRVPPDLFAEPGADLRFRTRGEGPAHDSGGETRHADRIASSNRSPRRSF